MSYLVDGNNVMGQRVGWHRDKPGARRRLMGELARFARRAGLSVEVVFDGAPEDHFPDGSSFMRALRVFYAARGSDADARIKALVEESRERRTLVVVTSDRALANYVRRCGARVERAGDFRRRLDESEETHEEEAAARKKKGGERDELEASGEGVEQWMRYFGVAPEDDEE